MDDLADLLEAKGVVEYRVKYPFVRDTYQDFNEDGYYDRPTWKPGVMWEEGFADATAFAHGEGEMILTAHSVHKPGRFPTRVFLTREFISPDGNRFGKGKLHIWTLEKFNRLKLGYKFHYEIVPND